MQCGSQIDSHFMELTPQREVSSMGCGSEMMVSGDLGDCCNMVSYISPVEEKTYRSICDSRN